MLLRDLGLAVCVMEKAASLVPMQDQHPGEGICGETRIGLQAGEGHLTETQPESILLLKELLLSIYCEL